MQIFSLKPGWNRIAPVSVEASVDVCESFIAVDFAVREVPSCFCRNKEQDGEAVWQDSCVEIFLKTFDGRGYANFEFNSKGVCYAARGKDRQNRTEFSKSEYMRIMRKPSGISVKDGFYIWALSVQIPGVLLGAEAGALRTVEGNLYKCADLAVEPHYLFAFSVDTPEPDFHRPEFFKSLHIIPNRIS